LNNVLANCCVFNIVALYYVLLFIISQFRIKSKIKSKDDDCVIV